MKIAVMSDDFTGANDIGVQLNRYGLTVVSAIENIEREEADVIVYDTESRNIDENTAKERVSREFKKMRKKGFDFFYKKIDSTLRGNIAKEVEAISENIDSGNKIAVVIAFPAIGRVIKNGEHFLNGKKLIETEIANDPVSPVKEGDLKKIFNKSIYISYNEVKNGSGIKKIESSNEKIIIFDSETEEELKNTAKFLAENGLDKYIIGSAGLMNYLPEFWGIKNRTVIISGSCSSVSIQQIDEFINVFDKEIEIVELDILDIKDRNGEEIKYKKEKDIVIRSIVEREQMEKVMYYFEQNGVSRQRAGDIISDYISEESLKYIEANSIQNIIILGGETSFKILKALKIKGLKIEFEIETGIAFAKSENMRYNIIVKPGNFGSIECVKKCYELIKKRKI